MPKIADLKPTNFFNPKFIDWQFINLNKKYFPQIRTRLSALVLINNNDESSIINETEHKIFFKRILGGHHVSILSFLIHENLTILLVTGFREDIEEIKKFPGFVKLNFNCF